MATRPIRNFRVVKPYRKNQEKPQTVVFNHVVNRRYLVQGLQDAGFEIEGATSFYTFREPKMDVVFTTRRHGKRALEALSGGLQVTRDSKKKMTATTKYGRNYDEAVDVLGRDPNKALPEVQKIRDTLLKAFGLTQEEASAKQNTNGSRKFAKKLKTNTEVDKNDGIAAWVESVPQGDLGIQSQHIAIDPLDEPRYVRPKQAVRKRSRGLEEDPVTLSELHYELDMKYQMYGTNLAINFKEDKSEWTIPTSTSS